MQQSSFKVQQCSCLHLLQLGGEQRAVPSHNCVASIDGLFQDPNVKRFLAGLEVDLNVS